MSQWKKLWSDDDGQDTVEYVLLLAFIALTSAALITLPGNSVSTIWLAENNTLSGAAITATS
ncbi:MAG: Flp family type IVb pilin [Bryobacteraceae bacterium]|jgi:Flp pilus assembly pilin Flp